MPDERTPEELERAQRLFDQLAAEEPPIDAESDTAASKTAPRNAISDNTQPIRTQASQNAASNSDPAKYLVTLVLGLILVVSLVASLMVFLSGGEDDPDEPSIAENDRPLINPQAPTLAPTEPPQATDPPPTAVSTEPPRPTPQTFVIDLPAAPPADVVGVWLQRPAEQVNFGLGEVTRAESAFTFTGGSDRLGVIPYVVQPGDTLSKLADQFGLEVCSIIWANPRNLVSPMRPGYTLDILPVNGVLYRVDREITIQQIADETQVDPYDIIDSPYNDLSGVRPEAVLVEGIKVVVPAGSGGDCNVWAPPSASVGGTGASSAGGGIRSSGSLWGCAYAVESPGVPATRPIGGRYNFFQGFTAAHTGVDLSAPTGTPVLAAGSGTVAFAGWNTYGYGNAIVVDHGGSYTLYAHLDSYNVSCGQSVGAGSQIGQVGSTGRSSGPHLHFEIRDAGFNPINPVFSIGL